MSSYSFKASFTLFYSDTTYIVAFNSNKVTEVIKFTLTIKKIINDMSVSYVTIRRKTFSKLHNIPATKKIPSYKYRTTTERKHEDRYMLLQ